MYRGSLSFHVPELLTRRRAYLQNPSCPYYGFRVNIGHWEIGTRFPRDPIETNSLGQVCKMWQLSVWVKIWEEYGVLKVERAMRGDVSVVFRVTREWLEMKPRCSRGKWVLVYLVVYGDGRNEVASGCCFSPGLELSSDLRETVMKGTKRDRCECTQPCVTSMSRCSRFLIWLSSKSFYQKYRRLIVWKRIIAWISCTALNIDDRKKFIY